MKRSAPHWITASLIAGLIIFLEISTQAGWIPQTLIPPPTETGVALYGLFPDIGPHIGTTFLELLIASTAAFFIGGTLGYLFWRVPAVGAALEPFIIALYAVPLVLFYPFMLVVLGLGPQSVIVIATAMGTVPVALNVWIGLRQLPPIYLNVARTCRCTPWQTISKVILPGAAPLLFAGFKLGFIYSFIGVISSEFITAVNGLGFLVAYDYNAFFTTKMFAEIVLIIIIAASLNSLLLYLERKLT